MIQALLSQQYQQSQPFLHCTRTMPSMILDQLKSGFTTRSVGSETPMSGSWICMLLRFCSELQFSTFNTKNTVDIQLDNLVVGNILPQVMEYS